MHKQNKDRLGSREGVRNEDIYWETKEEEEEEEELPSEVGCMDRTRTYWDKYE
jgi:hypothetical protein